MRRGEIWWADLPPPAGRRPVLLVSRHEAYAVRELLLVAPVTTRMRGIPTEVPLDKKDGLPKRCVVNADTLTTVPKRCLSNRVAALSTTKLREVDAALKFALGLD